VTIPAGAMRQIAGRAHVVARGRQR
jgi:hypothetical protein